MRRVQDAEAKRRDESAIFLDRLDLLLYRLLTLVQRSYLVWKDFFFLIKDKAVHNVFLTDVGHGDPNSDGGDITVHKYVRKLLSLLYVQWDDTSTLAVTVKAKYRRDTYSAKLSNPGLLLIFFKS